MTNPLERQMVECKRCDKSGEVHINDGFQSIIGRCPACRGTKKVPEPAEQWAERCAKIANKLVRKVSVFLCPAHSGSICRDCASYPPHSNACAKTILDMVAKEIEDEA